MKLTYNTKTYKISPWIIYDKADRNEYKVDLYLKLTEKFGAHLIEVDKYIEIIENNKISNIKIDIAVYNEKLNLIKAIVITDLNKNSKDYKVLKRKIKKALDITGNKKTKLEIKNPNES